MKKWYWILATLAMLMVADTASAACGAGRGRRSGRRSGPVARLLGRCG